MTHLTNRMIVRSGALVGLVVLLATMPTAAAVPTNVCAMNVTATPNPDGSILIEWDAVAGATLYGVFRGTDGPAGAFDGTAVDPPATSYLDTTAVMGVTYDYFVIANPHFGRCTTVQATSVPFFSGALLSGVAVAGSLLAFVGFRRLRS